MRDSRVLHLPLAALYQPTLMVDGLRTLGVKADHMLFSEAFNSFVPGGAGDYVTGKSVISSVNFHFMAHALDNYDVFHIHSGYGFFYDSTRGKQFSLLKKLGKTVVFSRWGCRDGSPPSLEEENTGECSKCPILSSVCNDAICRERLDAEERNADFIIDHVPGHEGYGRNTEFLAGMIDTAFWSPDVAIPASFIKDKRAGEIRIIHAVGGNDRGDVKGSAEVKRTVDELRASGHDISLEYITNVTCEELRYHILQADIVVDQLCAGYFGSFARESMALGKPVIGTLRPRYRDYFPGVPMLAVEDKPLGQHLADLIASPERRKDLGRKSREYAVKGLCHRKLSASLLDMYRNARAAKRSGRNRHD